MTSGGSPVEPTVDDVPLPTRVRHALKRAGLVMLLDVLERPDAELLRIPDFGEAALRQIRRIRADLGVPEPPEPPRRAPARKSMELARKSKTPAGDSLVGRPRQGATAVTRHNERRIEHKKGIVLAALDAGATLGSLAEHYEVQVPLLRRWLTATVSEVTLSPNQGHRHKPRWQDPHPLLRRPLALADPRDLADWIATREWHEQELQQWETDGGPAAREETR